MQAGQLRHRLKIYEQAQTRSATGAVQKKWQHILTIWGQFTPLSVKDLMTNQTQNSQITARAKIRYREDIHSGQRVEWRGKMYEIDGEPLADNQTANQFMTLALKSP